MLCQLKTQIAIDDAFLSAVFREMASRFKKMHKRHMHCTYSTRYSHLKCKNKKSAFLTRLDLGLSLCHVGFYPLKRTATTTMYKYTFKRMQRCACVCMWLIFKNKGNTEIHGKCALNVLRLFAMHILLSSPLLFIHSIIRLGNWMIHIVSIISAHIDQLALARLSVWPSVSQKRVTKFRSNNTQGQS